MKIDIYNHVMPVKFLEQMKELGADANLLKRMSSIRMLWDIEARVEMLKSKFPEVQQVLTLSVPSPEMVGGPDKSPMLARIANDEMAAMVKRWPQQFPCFVASLPMNNVPAALEEMDRAINVLGAEHQALATQFATKAIDRFAGVAWHKGPYELPLIDGAVAAFTCFNRSRYAEGDHVIFVGEVERCTHREAAAPLVYHASQFFTGSLR